MIQKNILVENYRQIVQNAHIRPSDKLLLLNQIIPRFPTDDPARFTRNILSAIQACRLNPDEFQNNWKLFHEWIFPYVVHFDENPTRIVLRRTDELNHFHLETIPAIFHFGRKTLSWVTQQLALRFFPQLYPPRAEYLDQRSLRNFIVHSLSRVLPDISTPEELSRHIGIANDYLKKHGRTEYIRHVVTENFGRLIPVDENPKKADRLSFYKTGSVLIPMAGK